MPAFLRLTKWREYQHYSDRSPPWIKLHRDLLSSRTWVSSSTESRVLAVASMMLASCTDNKIPLDAVYFRRVAYLDFDPDFGQLLDLAFLEIVDENGELLADCSRDASKVEQMLAQRRGEERRAEENVGVGFEVSPKNLTPSLETPEPARARKVNGHSHEAVELLNFLNERVGKNFRPTDENLKLIEARLRSGVPAIRVRQVILRKWREWQDRPDMHQYLRPSTLFNATKFEQYLGELPPIEPPKPRDLLAAFEAAGGGDHPEANP